MLDRTDDLSAAAQHWLANFETAIAKCDEVQLNSLFHRESYWRDVLALSWTLQTINGADAIARDIKDHASRASPGGFAIDRGRAQPRRVTRAGTASIEAIFKFETAIGRGSGIVRLIPDPSDGNRLKMWTLLTALEELKGFEEKLGYSRPRGEAYSRDFRGPNWLDLRKAAARYDDRDPAVLSWAAGRPDLRSPRVSSNCRSMPSLSTASRASVTTGASAITR